MAWLNTRPDKVEGDKTAGLEPTRAERLKAEGVGIPALPPCSATYLVDYLFEIGPVVHTAAGDAPIPHTEIAAWQANTCIRLSPWEARTLRRLSVDFVAESQRAKERDCKSPWQSPDALIDRVVKANVQKNAFRQLANL